MVAAQDAAQSTQGFIKSSAFKQLCKDGNLVKEEAEQIIKLSTKCNLPPATHTHTATATTHSSPHNIQFGGGHTISCLLLVFHQNSFSFYFF